MRSKSLYLCLLLLAAPLGAANIAVNSAVAVNGNTCDQVAWTDAAGRARSASIVQLNGAATAGVKTLALVADVTQRAQVEAAVAKTIETFGRLDILVNNAGTNIRAPIESIQDDDWAKVQSINVTGVLNGCRAVVPHMIQRGYGRIINIGSALSMIGLAGRINYCASKGAVLQMTKALALELASHGITVNCLCPGPFATEINRPLIDNPIKAQELLAHVPMARWGEMSEIRTPIVFLASPGASFVTGAVLSVDGGWVAG